MKNERKMKKPSKPKTTGRIQQAGQAIEDGIFYISRKVILATVPVEIQYSLRAE